MAKQTAKEKSMEEALWESANKLRGSVEPSEYKHVVLSLIFLKYANDRFMERYQELVDDGKENFANNPVLFIDDDKSKVDEFFENNSEDKVPELFNEYQTKELNVTDLVIYEMIEE